MDEELRAVPTESERKENPVRSRLKRFLHDKSRLLLFLTVFVSVLPWLATVVWVFELASHFRLQYLAASVFLLAVMVAFRDWRWSLVGLAAMGINGAAIIPWYVASGATPGVRAEGKLVRVLLSNVHTSNTNSAGLLDLIQSEAPDIVVLQEIDHRWLSELAALQPEYPYRNVVPRGDNFGIGLWSRTPLIEPEIVAFEEWGVPSIRARVEIAGRNIVVVATHPLPPAGHSGYHERNRHLLKLAKLTAAFPDPVILLGDLNVTMWSPDYAQFITDSRLVNARKGFGVLPTWPAQLPIAMIPLDHCLVSPSIGVKDMRTGRNFGSDHLPVVADLIVPPGGPVR